MLGLSKHERSHGPSQISARNFLNPGRATPQPERPRSSSTTWKSLHGPKPRKSRKSSSGGHLMGARILRNLALIKKQGPAIKPILISNWAKCLANPLEDGGMFLPEASATASAESTEEKGLDEEVTKPQPKKD